MRIVNSPRFLEELEAIVEYIAQESPSSALSFLDRLLDHLQQLQAFPDSGRLRKSERTYPIRELIYQGYTIPYLIDRQRDQIVLLGIFNRNLWKEE